MRSVASACHISFLDDSTGCGVLVRPLPGDDVPSPDMGGCTLHEADRRALLWFLDQQGWELIDDDDELAGVEGYTADGRMVVGMYGRNPEHVTLDVDVLAESFSELHRLAGVVARVPADRARAAVKAEMDEIARRDSFVDGFEETERELPRACDIPTQHPGPTRRLPGQRTGGSTGLPAHEA